MKFTPFQRSWVVDIVFCLVVFAVIVGVFMQSLQRAREVEQSTQELKELVEQLKAQFDAMHP